VRTNLILGRGLKLLRVKLFRKRCSV